jgi:hypothetical protein
MPHTVHQVTFYFIPVVTSGVICGLVPGVAIGFALRITPFVTKRVILKFHLFSYTTCHLPILLLFNPGNHPQGNSPSHPLNNSEGNFGGEPGLCAEGEISGQDFARVQDIVRVKRGFEFSHQVKFGCG